MNPFKSLIAKAAAWAGLPTRRQNWLGPRFEPVNISALATVESV